MLRVKTSVTVNTIYMHIRCLVSEFDRSAHRAAYKNKPEKYEKLEPDGEVTDINTA